MQGCGVAAKRISLADGKKDMSLINCATLSKYFEMESKDSWQVRMLS
jgi:hypothetical protein